MFIGYENKTDFNIDFSDMYKYPSIYVSEKEEKY